MLLVLLLVSFSSEPGLSGETCPDICTFVYNDPNWSSKHLINSRFTQRVESGTLGPGIVTAEYFKNGDIHGFGNANLHFTTGGGNPLVIRFRHSTLAVYGEHGGTKGTMSLDILDKKDLDYFQISDKNSDHYVIIVGDKKTQSKNSFNYNYNSDKIWKEFQSNKVRLRDTVTIEYRPNLESPVFKYISICPDATPRLCDDEQPPTIEAEIGAPYTLTCTAIGAPFLDASWTKDGEFRPSSRDSDDNNHRITSKIEIKSFTVDDIGRWMCTIHNRNFGDRVTKTHDLRYSSEVNLEQAPSQDFYVTKANESTTFEWIVVGWPLDEVTLNCENVEETKLSTDTSGHRETDPPSVKLQLVLQDEDQVLCSVQQGGKVLGTTNITRVGYGCQAGERGVEKRCEECPLGETSLKGSADCFAAQSDCKEGFYGTGSDCSPCPKGESSPANSVKVQECLKVSHASGVSIALVIGASVAAALITAGLFLLVPILVRMYKKKKMESDDLDTKNRVNKNDTEITITDNSRVHKAGQKNTHDDMAYRDGIQEYYLAGEASEIRPPPLPPREEQPLSGATKKTPARTRKRQRKQRTTPNLKQELEGTWAGATQPESTAPSEIYIENTVVPDGDQFYDHHYYEDLDSEVRIATDGGVTYQTGQEVRRW